MNRIIGSYSSITAAIMVFLFAISLITGILPLSYIASFIFSWTYLLMTCAFYVRAPKERRVAALAGTAFACVYVALIGLVYFTQLTAVMHQTESVDVVLSLTFSPGRWFFFIDLLGYAFLSLSVFFAALSLAPKSKADRWLKGLMLVHGIYAPACIILPMLNVFRTDAPGGDMAGVIALLFWCVHFVPIAVLSALHMSKSNC